MNYTLRYRSVRHRGPSDSVDNQGGRVFSEIADAAGLNDGPMKSRRGTAVGDINNDGKLDVVVFNVGEPPSVFLNQSENGNHFVLIRLVGVKSNKAAIGARIIVTTTDGSQLDEVCAGSSYLSTSGPRLHFGLGSNSIIKKIEIMWPSGLVQEFHDIRADAIYELEEGQGIRKTEPPQSLRH